MIDQNDQQFPLCLSPDEYILQSVDPLTGRTACVPAIQRGSAKQPVPMIFGMTFLRSFYTVFDLDQSRIGFARNNLSPLPAGSTCVAFSHPLLRQIIWWISVATATFSVLFALYVFVVPKDLSVHLQQPMAGHEAGSNQSE